MVIGDEGCNLSMLFLGLLEPPRLLLPHSPLTHALFYLLKFNCKHELAPVDDIFDKFCMIAKRNLAGRK